MKSLSVFKLQLREVDPTCEHSESISGEESLTSVQEGERGRMFLNIAYKFGRYSTSDIPYKRKESRRVIVHTHTIQHRIYMLPFQPLIGHIEWKV
jgi:DNA polymerase III sliding clamp (beta) subunit (PCNA family)